ncbi:MAG: hypothetical protein ACYDCW_02125 [Acidithiobacillus ferrivorans]
MPVLRLVPKAEPSMSMAAGKTATLEELRSIAIEDACLIAASRDANGWLMARWFREKDQRTYRIDMVRDLFGEVVLIKQWGRRGYRRGGAQELLLGTAPSEEDMTKAIFDVCLRRLKRGYHLRVDLLEIPETEQDFGELSEEDLQSLQELLVH